MDNQHKKIKGYRDLSEEEIALMNECKELAVKLGDLTTKIQKSPLTNTTIQIDQRWLAIGITDLQKGFMSIIRSIAKPTTF